MNFCHNCGHKITEGNENFYPNCGINLQQVMPEEIGGNQTNINHGQKIIGGLAP